jgi:hypothetical protein
MKLMPLGDYYVWECDWCDSQNSTLWTRIEQGKVTCGVCYATFAISPSPVVYAGSLLSQELP